MKCDKIILENGITLVEKGRNMPEMTRTVQLAHLLPKGTGASINQDIIVEAMYRMRDSVDINKLKEHIIKLFGVVIPDSHIEAGLLALLEQGQLSKNSEGYYDLSLVTTSELSKQKLEDAAVFDAALGAWVSRAEFDNISNDELEALMFC